MRPSRKNMRGTSMTELMVSVAVASILSIGFFTALSWISKVHTFEKRLTFYSSEVREVIHQIARDLRAAGSNPLSRPFLFDGDPWSDRAILLDPGGDGDFTNDLEVHFDRYGGTERNDPDGDANDAREAIRYQYLASAHQITRFIREEGNGDDDDDDVWGQEVILVNVCAFEFRYYDSLKRPTLNADLVSWVDINATTTTAPAECYQQDEITQDWTVRVKLRNR